MGKIIYKDVIKKEIKNFKESKEKLVYLIGILSSLNDIKSNIERNTDINQLIKYIENRIEYINKNTDDIEELKYKKNQYKIVIEDVEKIKENMQQGLLVIVTEPLEYINALSDYISSVDISSNYNNIMSYIRELNNYFVENNLSVITQQYYIKYLINLLEKVSNRTPKDDTKKYDVLDIIRNLNNFKYNDIKIEEVTFQSINFDKLDSLLKQNIKLQKVSVKFDVYDESEYVLILLDYLKQVVPKMNDDFISNKYALKITDYIDENLLKLDSNYYLTYLNELIEIRTKLYEKIKVNNKDKSILGRLNKDVNSLIKRIEQIKTEDIEYYNSEVYIYRALKYIINDIKDIDLLLEMINKIPNCIDNNVFNETIENYFNIILNSKNNSLIIYYQKVIEIVFHNCDLDKNSIINIINEKINRIIERDSFIKRDDYKYRTILLKHTFLILNKVSGYYYNEILKNILKTKEIKVNNKTIFTLDSEGTKTKENAFSIEKKNENKYILTIYTSDITTYFDDKDFKDKLESFIINKDIKLGKDAIKYSLDENEYKDTIAFKFEIDNNCNILDLKVTKERIKVAKNFYYNTFEEEIKKVDNDLQNQIDELYYLAINIVKNTQENSSLLDYYKDISSTKVSNINSIITTYCNSMINGFFKEKGLPLIDRESISIYCEEVRTKVESKKQIPNIDELLLSLGNKYKTGVIYNSSNHNFNGIKHSKISAPLREVDSFINQALAYYYSNYNISKEEINMINFVLDGICDELNYKHKQNKQKKLTKSKKVVKLNKSEEEDMVF